MPVRIRDGLGSSVGLTDGSGNQVATYSFDVFGAIRQQTGNAANDWLFTGQQRDSDSGLFYLRARYYDPATGRFLSRDPLLGRAGQPTTQNRYVYFGNNPVNLVDPTGLAAESTQNWNCIEIDGEVHWGTVVVTSDCAYRRRPLVRRWYDGRGGGDARLRGAGGSAASGSSSHS